MAKLASFDQTHATRFRVVELSQFLNLGLQFLNSPLVSLILLFKERVHMDHLLAYRTVAGLQCIHFLHQFGNPGTLLTLPSTLSIDAKADHIGIGSQFSRLRLRLRLGLRFRLRLPMMLMVMVSLNYDAFELLFLLLFGLELTLDCKLESLDDVYQFYLLGLKHILICIYQLQLFLQHPDLLAQFIDLLILFIQLGLQVFNLVLLDGSPSDLNFHFSNTKLSELVFEIADSILKYPFIIFLDTIQISNFLGQIELSIFQLLSFQHGTTFPQSLNHLGLSYQLIISMATSFFSCRSNCSSWVALMTNSSCLSRVMKWWLDLGVSRDEDRRWDTVEVAFGDRSRVFKGNKCIY